MAYDFYFTPRAEQDLDDILSYISFVLKNETAARNLGNKIFEQIDNVCLFPLSGSLVSNELFVDNSIRKLIIDNYVLYYIPNEQEKRIYILRVVYGQRNLDNVLRNI